MPPLCSKTSMYLPNRKLVRPFAGRFSLGGFIIGCVTAGLFFGWQTRLVFGWANMIAALALAAVMYTILLLSVCEMCAALPFTSGLSAFTQAAFDSMMCAVSGSLYSMSFVLWSATLLVSLGNVVETIFQNLSSVFSDTRPLFYWIPIILVTIMIHCRPRIFFRATLLLSVYSSILLLTYLAITFVIEPPKSSAERTRIDYSKLSIDLSGLSMPGIIRAFPFACTLFMGIEAFPAASEETKRISKTAPPVAAYCFFVLAFFSVGLLATVPDQSSQNRINVACEPMASTTLSSVSYTNSSKLCVSQHFVLSKFLLLDNALSLVCSTYTPSPEWCKHILHNTGKADTPHKNPLILMFIALAVFPPLYLSFIAGTYVSARHIYSLSRSGILPLSISRTHAGSPVFATCASLILAVIAISLINACNRVPNLVQSYASPNMGGFSYSMADNTLVNLRLKSDTNFIIVLVHVWVSCLTYIITFTTFIVLRVRLPNLPRPFGSPVGIIGAYLGLFISTVIGIIGPLFVCPLLYGIMISFMVLFMVVAALCWLFIAKIRVANCPEKIITCEQLKQIWGR